MKNFLLNLSGFLYGLIAALHFLRFFLKWPVTVGTVAVPVAASLWAGLIFLLLSLSCLLVSRRNP